MQSQVFLLIGIGALMFIIIGGLSLIAHYYTLNGIKSKTVGDGQHGVARFATQKEIIKTYKHIPFQVSQWRKGKNLPCDENGNLTQGLVVGCKGNKGDIVGLVDTGDVHCLMIGAAGVGKTAFFLYPNLEYACASGMSFITTDTKGVRPDRVR